MTQAPMLFDGFQHNHTSGATCRGSFARNFVSRWSIFETDSKFPIKSSLNTPPHLNRVATLPCEISVSCLTNKCTPGRCFVPLNSTYVSTWPLTSHTCITRDLATFLWRLNSGGLLQWAADVWLLCTRVVITIDRSTDGAAWSVASAARSRANRSIARKF